MAIESRSFKLEKYRFGFNGKENDKDFGIGHVDFGARIYDSETGRWFATDPVQKAFQSDYTFGADNPIIFVDPDGGDDFYFNYETSSWTFKKTGAPHRFYLFEDGKPVQYKIHSAEISGILYKNRDIFRQAYQTANQKQKRKLAYSFRRAANKTWHPIIQRLELLIDVVTTGGAVAEMRTGIRLGQTIVHGKHGKFAIRFNRLVNSIKAWWKRGRSEQAKLDKEGVAYMKIWPFKKIKPEQISINYDKVKNKIMSHSFSKKHIRRGIMDLGESKEQIADEAISIIEANKSDLIEGSNDIITYMNGHEARVKAFVKDGEVISGNVFKGTSNRESPNLINNKKSD